ncbi:MAG: redoxin domain-containing protein [Actinobacteria bacterium]|nr:redoxin domain-containing protein [Actinomycetota bacterium]
MNDVFWVSYVTLWLVLLVQGLAFLEVLRQLGTLRRQIGPLQGAGVIPRAVDTGSPLPELKAIRGEDLEPARWRDYLSAEFGVIVFLTLDCVTCRTIAAELAGFAKDAPVEANVMAVVIGGVDEAAEFISKYGLDPSLAVIDPDGSLAKTLGVSWSPGALTIRNGSLGVAAIVNSIYQIDSLLHEEVGKQSKVLAGHPHN